MLFPGDLSICSTSLTERERRYGKFQIELLPKISSKVLLIVETYCSFVYYLFQLGDKVEFLCQCSFLEIYNEQIFDLLDPTSTGLQLREDIKKGVFVDGLLEKSVSSARDVYNVSYIRLFSKFDYVNARNVANL